MLAAIAVGCDDGVPSSESATPVQARQAAAAPESPPRLSQEQAAARVEEGTVELQPEARPEESSEPEPRAEQADESVQPEPEVEDSPRELTESPAIVVVDADMRVRPGLAWRVVRRLATRDEVLVLNRTGGWLRIRVDDCDGWIRSSALDLGEVDEDDILEQPAPPIIADWRGVEYGVMGQSADADTVRLLGHSEEIVSAPKSEVTLLVSDINLDDLPVLIGDETVIFPGDDFRAGQGKILPRADEWLWLPWGWLLAHNDEYIWQWRPETDELEFIARPPGFAKLSTNGRYLAIAECVLGLHDSHCPYFSDVLILPLDGSPVIRLREALQAAYPDMHLAVTDDTMHSFADEPLLWNSQGNVLLVRLELNGWFLGAASMTPSGAVVLFGHWAPDDGVHPACGFDDFDWHFFSDDTVSASGWCIEEGTGTAVTVWHRFSLGGEYLRTTRLNWEGISWSESQDRIRLADTEGNLAETFSHSLSPDRSLALVVSQPSGTGEPLTLWLFATEEDDLIPIRNNRRGAITGRLDSHEFRSLTFWYGNEQVVVQQVGDSGWDIGAAIVDISEARFSEFEIEELRQSHYVYLNGAWDPGGKRFRTFVPLDTRESVTEGFFATDGLQTSNRDIHLLVIGEHDGSLEAAILTVGDRSAFAGPRHRAEWSEQGEWFVFGHEQRRLPLYGH